jgi:hypothetical protein
MVDRLVSNGSALTAVAGVTVPLPDELATTATAALRFSSTDRDRVLLSLLATFGVDVILSTKLEELWRWSSTEVLCLNGTPLLLLLSSELEGSGTRTLLTELAAWVSVLEAIRNLLLLSKPPVEEEEEEELEGSGMSARLLERPSSIVLLETSFPTVSFVEFVSLSWQTRLLDSPKPPPPPPLLSVTREELNLKRK